MEIKRAVIIVLSIIGVVVLAAAGFICFLTITEFKPAPIETIDVITDRLTKELPKEFSILSLNIGYGGLGREADFFMDGGKSVQSADRATVEKNLNGIQKIIQGSGCDIVVLQEVDTDSARSYGIDEAAALRQGFSAFALNYSCPFVPFPLPPIGRVHSGLLTISDYGITSAERVSLPCPFSWPVRIANLKRCLLVSRLPIADSDKSLVLVNLHLEAYDDGEGKRAQTEQLWGLIQKEYDQGNYVIVGGDFNQAFPGSFDVYPIHDSMRW